MKRKHVSAVEAVAANHGSGIDYRWPKTISGFSQEPAFPFPPSLPPITWKPPRSARTSAGVEEEITSHVDESEFVVVVKVRGQCPAKPGICWWEPRSSRVVILEDATSERARRLLWPLLASRRPAKVVIGRTKTLGWFAGALGDVRDLRKAMAVRNPAGGAAEETLDRCSHGVVRQAVIDQVEATAADDLTPELVRYVLFNVGRLWTALEQEVIFVGVPPPQPPPDIAGLLPFLPTMVVSEIHRKVPHAQSLQRITFTPGKSPVYLVDENGMAQSPLSDLRPIQQSEISRTFDRARGIKDAGHLVRVSRGADSAIKKLEVCVNRRVPNVPLILGDLVRSLSSRAKFAVAVFGGRTSGKSTVIRELAIDIAANMEGGFQIFLPNRSEIFCFNRITRSRQMSMYPNLEGIEAEGPVHDSLIVADNLLPTSAPTIQRLHRAGYSILAAFELPTIQS